MGRAEVRTERAEDKGVSRCLAKPDVQGVRFTLKRVVGSAMCLSPSGFQTPVRRLGCRLQASREQ